MKCFYHESDLDGHCSGALVRYAFPECEMIGFNYGYSFPLVSIDDGETVFLVDISLDPQDMRDLASVSDLIWIDHHDTAIQNNKNLDCRGIRENGTAACELTWRWLFPMQECPWPVKMLAWYDIWDHSDPDVLTFQYGMRLRNSEYDIQAAGSADFWARLLESTALAEKIMGDGATALKYQTEQNKLLCDHRVEVMNADVEKYAIVNAPFANSLIFSTFPDKSDLDYLIAYSFQRKGHVKISVYTEKEGKHAGKFCQSYGGGGHAGAGGFSLDLNSRAQRVMFFELIGVNNEL